MLYNPPTGGAANDPYVGKNTTAGTQGSKVPPAAIEYTQREIVAAIAASNQAPTNTVLVQAAMALGRGIWVDNLTGSGDLAVATLGVVLPSFLKGMRIGATATATNTTTSPRLRVANLGSAGGTQDFPIVKADGSALAVGDIKAGRIYRFEADGAGNVIISGGGLSTGGTGVAASARVSTTTGSSVVAIAGSTNISSITLGTSTYAGNGTNTLVVSFATPMPNDRYSVLITPGIDVGGNPPSGSEAHLLGAPTVNGFTIVMMGNSSGIYPDFQTSLSFAVIPNP